MKILCPIDFSKCSENALSYAISIAQEFPQSEIHLLHCIDFIANNDGLRLAADILKEESQNKMSALMKRIRKDNSNIEFRGDIFISSPKRFVNEYANEHSADLIIMGTTGLTRLKNISFGSVAEEVTRASKAPVLLIPNGMKYDSIKTIVIGDDGGSNDKSPQLRFLKYLLTRFEPKVNVVHFSDDVQVTWDPLLRAVLDLYDTQYSVIKKQGKISSALNTLSLERKADIITIFHKRRSWLSDIFHHSILREELFRLKLPLLVLPSN